jgi:hypothetical protein
MSESNEVRRLLRQVMRGIPFDAQRHIDEYSVDIYRFTRFEPFLRLLNQALQGTDFGPFSPMQFVAMGKHFHDLILMGVNEDQAWRWLRAHLTQVLHVLPQVPRYRANGMLTNVINMIREWDYIET